MAARAGGGRAGGAERAVPPLLVSTAALLLAGLLLPALHVSKGLSSDAHSILGGIVSLLAGGDVLLGLIVLAFSVLFPGFKLAALFVIRRGNADGAREKVAWLGLLGKWSMLDVWVVAIFVGAVRLGILAEFEARPGIYVFAAAVISSIVTTHAIRRELERRRRRTPAWDRLRSIPGRAWSLVALGLFAAGISLPLVEIEKWLFWSSEESLLSALGTLVEEEQIPLAVLVGVFVVLLPGAHFAGTAALRWIPRLPERTARVLLALEEWTMLDVFAVSLLVAVAQIASSASITPKVGLWLLLAAAAASAVDAWLLRSAARR